MEQLNYFTLLDLPVSLALNSSDLDNALYKQQLLYHPDRCIHMNDKERLEHQRKSNSLNRAYITLLDFTSRLEHILGIKGIEIEGLAPDMSLMLEAMEWRESDMGHAWANQYASLIQDAALDAWQASDFALLSQAYLRLKFFNRFLTEK